MPSEKQRYEPVPPIPTYDEAIASGSNSGWQQRDLAPSPIDDTGAGAVEGQSLLGSQHAHNPTDPASQPSRGRRPGGYRAPTVETDDEDNLFSSDDSDSDEETRQVRREMQELEIDDSDVRGGSRSSWGKRIGLSLPQWRWRWKWKLPRLRRRTATTEEGNTDPEAANTETETSTSRFAFPKFGSAALLLLVARILAIFMLLGFLYLIFASDMFTSMARRMSSSIFAPERVRVYIEDSINPGNLQDHSRHFTSYAHIAGTEGDYALMEYTESLFNRYGLENVRRDTYHVYLNYPKAGGRSVEILGDDGKVKWTAKLEEDEVGGETAGRQTYAFHGHSKSGDVKGPLIYAHYGSREDFQMLKDRGIGTKGAIALVRYHGPQPDRALKVKAAELAGFAGCLIYTDPKDAGYLKGPTAPVGRFMPADAVQRGSVSLMSWVVGDVLTPGWGSKKDQPRVKVEQAEGLVKIPSLPLGWRDAQILLQHLKGHGQHIPDGWAGGVPSIDEWWTGNLSSPIVRLKNEQDEVEKQPIWNVYGRIGGIEQDEKSIIIGNHRDSWAFGAADPASGTAIMMEVIRVFGNLLKQGWRPLRTIEFMSWDAEEYNLIGSTEYVEQNDDLLRKNALAYINLDTAVTGNEFHAAGNPVFKKLLLEVLARTGDPNYPDPNDNTKVKSLLDLWNERSADLEGLGAGSDYVAFQDIAGTASLDLHFDGPGYPYHSSYENFDWMDRVGDPGFIYHTILARVVGLLTFELSNRPIMPFDMPAYADKLSDWVSELETWALKQPGYDGKVFKVSKLKEAADEVAMAVRQFTRWETEWENRVISTNGYETNGLGDQRGEYNARMGRFDSDLLDIDGIPGRKQFKHVIFGPQLWAGYEEGYFPSVRDAVQEGNWEEAMKRLEKVAGIIIKAAENLAAR
ncbi:putative glutamate carboxypeptidase 2 [Triangularia setosa]|uniref:Glutamate carboxypeptidase 2 n=1 Tax=Triangularia setosa TaxID=2587417 RepID=A0AAN7A7J0_9PEZI|nr:putative glutamate carboxypeptidase 2 [Podospora setosa]